MQYRTLLKALNKFFSDRSRSAAETKSDLQSLRDEIDVLIGKPEEPETPRPKYGGGDLTWNSPLIAGEGYY